MLRRNSRQKSVIISLVILSILNILLYLTLQESPDISPDNAVYSPSCICDDRGQNSLKHHHQFQCSRRGPHQKVLAYSLYGNSKNPKVFGRYFTLLNDICGTAEKIYPGWIVRIYHHFEPDDPYLCDIYCRHSDNVDLCSAQQIIDGHHDVAELIEPKYLKGLSPKMSRFLALLDPDVDVFLSRDVDSLILPREVSAVQQWLGSNFTFHLMRDHPAHHEIILAGMFGVKVYQRRDLIQGLATLFVMSGQTQDEQYADQDALSDILWPIARHDVMAHDSFQCQNDDIIGRSSLPTSPFPTKRDEDFDYVGRVEGDAPLSVKCPTHCRPVDHPEWEFC